MMRFVALVACVSMALDAFTSGGDLGLPQWAWNFVGFGWIFNGIYIAFRGTDA